MKLIKYSLFTVLFILLFTFFDLISKKKQTTILVTESVVPAHKSFQKQN